MGRKELAKRTNWQKYAVSAGSGREDIVHVILKQYLMKNHDYLVIPKPRVLSHIYGQWGIIPELGLEYLPTKRTAFIEDKRQGDNGNAHERLCKYFAPGIQKRCASIAGFYFPFFFVCMDGLAHDDKKVTEITAWFDADGFRDRCLLWRDKKDYQVIIDWFDNNIKPYLEGDKI